jgi:hypothetical protein
MTVALKAVGVPASSADSVTASGFVAAPKKDCQSTFEVTDCYGGVQARALKVSAPPFNGGLACPTGDVSVLVCNQSLQHLNWSYVVPREKWGTATKKTLRHAREIPLIVCPIGSKVTFDWTGRMHDVWQLMSEESYNTCNFTTFKVGAVNGGFKVSDAKTNSTYTMSCDTVGTYYFACSVDGACSKGSQKVRIYVSDPVKTVKLRAKGVPSLEQFNRKYTILFAGYYLNMEVLAENNADQAILDAQALLAHSPESCADWIPTYWNTNQSCQAFIYTDLGFLSRVRPDPDFEASERFYKIALEISPGMCGATAYLAELRVQQNRKSEADALYAEACAVCGQNSFDFHDLVLAYDNRTWTPPVCGKAVATTTKPTEQTVATAANRPTACADGTPQHSSCRKYARLLHHPDDHEQNYCGMGKVGSVRRRSWGGDAKDNCARTCGYCQAVGGPSLTSGVMKVMSPGRFLGIILPVLTLALLTRS